MATKLKKAPRWKVAVEVTSGGIKKFIERFDAGKTVKPFTFSLYPEKYEA